MFTVHIIPMLSKMLILIHYNYMDCSALIAIHFINMYICTLYLEQDNNVECTNNNIVHHYILATKLFSIEQL